MEFGAAIENYLKAIHKLDGAGQRCTPSAVAERLRVSPAAVTKMVKRLQELNLVRYARSQELALTPAGEKIALEVISHHRLIETYLKEALGYTWDQVDAEAEELEHVISEEFEARIDALLGYPTHDPHGDPIPSREGVLETAQHASLAELQPGQTAAVQRVSDNDPAMLRHLGDLGLYPGTEVEFVRQEPYGGSLHLRVAGVACSVGPELAQRVFVAPLRSEEAA